ncbi:MAG: fimbrillin family protein [Prevotella sp.]|nr:fimbrillin family protein [Prevotella sp.]
MKKAIFATLLGVLTLSGCTSSEIDEESVQANAIGFENVVKKPTRGVDDTSVSGDLTTQNLDEIYVYGYYTPQNNATNYIQVFYEEKVAKANNVWTYANTRYWIPDAKYNFYAYSCGDIKLKNEKGTPTLDLINDQYRVLRITNYVCDDSHQHDLIYAFNEGLIGKKVGEGNERVKFDFNHILTKISAEFVSEFDKDYDVYVSNVRLQNIRNIGSYDPKANDNYKWIGVERKESNATVSLSVPEGSKAVAGGTSVKTSSGYVIPYFYSNGDVQLLFDVVVKKGNEQVLSRHMSGSWSPNWTIGYNYNYRIRITGTTANLDKIEFSNMNVNGWAGTGVTDVNITFTVN